MSSNIYKREGVYYSDFRVNIEGKSKRIRKKLCRDKVDAQKMADQMETQMREENPEPANTFFGMLKVQGLGTKDITKPGVLSIQIEWDPKALLKALTSKKSLYLEIKGVAD